VPLAFTKGEIKGDYLSYVRCDMPLSINFGVSNIASNDIIFTKLT
jgi:hypothetical protein